MKILQVVMYACTVFCFCAKRSAAKSKADKIIVDGRLGALGLGHPGASIRDYVR